MIRFLACALFVGGAFFMLASADEPVKAERKVQLAVPKGDSTATKELAEIIHAANKTLQETKPDEVSKVLGATVTKVVAHARKHPTDESTLEVLVLAIGISIRSPEGTKTAEEAIELLKPSVMKTTVTKMPALTKHLRFLASGISDAGTALVRDVFKNHPDPLTQAHAAKELVKALESRVGLIKNMVKTEEVRARSEKEMGKETVQKLLDSVPQAMKDMEACRTALRTELKGLLPNLEVGGVAPESVSVNLDGKAVKLSDLKGKVVVLDFWTTACIPCRKMIPHARDLVKSMDGRPFVFVNISLDDDKDTLKEFFRTEPMPWTHWWDQKKTLAELWELRVLGTLYVIDHEGVIQFKSENYNPQSGALEKKIEELVKRAEAKR